MIADNSSNVEQYQILRLIGRSGTAHTWLTEDLAANRRLVAIKEPLRHRQFFVRDEMQRRYQQEVLVCSALVEAGATGIVRPLGTRTIQGNVVLLMEYAPGGELATLLKQNPRGLPVQQALRIARQVLESLALAHEHPWEIVHRNIKPPNILFDAQDRAQVADFGLAQLSNTSGGLDWPTFAHQADSPYMAPEQVNNRRQAVTPAADLYAVGAVLFEMLTGKRYSHVRSSIGARTLKGSIPDWLSRVVSKALAYEPLDRYETAEEFAATLADGENTLDTFAAIAKLLPNVGVHTGEQSEAAGQTISSSQVQKQLRAGEPLPPAEGAALLRTRAGEFGDESAVAAYTIVEACGGVPLPVFLAGSYLAQRDQKPQELAAWFGEQGLGETSSAERGSNSTSLLLKRSLERVTAIAREAFGVTGMLAPVPFDGEVMAAALCTSRAAAERALAELVGYGMLLRREEGYQVSHSLVYAYAREAALPHVGLIGRMARLYAAFAQEQWQMGPDGDAALEYQRPHILAVQAAALKAKLWDEVQGITWSLSKYLNHQGYLADAVTVVWAGLDAARAKGERRDESVHLSYLGTVCLKVGETRQAIECFETALAIDRQLGDSSWEGIDLSRLGTAYMMLGDANQAINKFALRLALARKQQTDQKALAAALEELGSVYAKQGDFHSAIDLYEERLKIVRDMGDRVAEGLTLSFLGDAYAGIGQTFHALELHEQVLPIARDVGDRWWESLALGKLGASHAALGGTRRAIEFYKQRIAMAREIGDRSGEDEAKAAIETLLQEEHQTA